MSLALKRGGRGAEICFLAIYFIFAFLKVIYHTCFDTPWMEDAINAVCLALACLFIIDRRWQEKGWILKVLIAVVFAISGYTTERSFMMAYGMLIMCADAASFRKIVMVSMASTMLAVVVTVGACLGGMIENRETVIGNGAIGYALGFNGRTGVPFHLFYVFLGYLYLRKEKLSWLELLFWAAVNYGIYYVAQVRLVCYLEYIVLILYVLFVKFEWLTFGKGILCGLFTGAFPLVFGGWAIFNRLYDPGNAFLAKLDGWLSNRLTLGYRALTEFDLTIFGQYIKMGKVKRDSWEGYFYIDSGFLYSLVAYGLLLTLVVLIMYSVISHYAVKHNQRVLFVWLCAIIIFALINNTWVDVGFNPLLMAFPILLNRGTLEEPPEKYGVFEKREKLE